MNYLSVAGKHHNYRDENNQDAVLFKEKGDYCAMVLADGVSSCEQSRTGAFVSCEVITEFLLTHSKRLFLMEKQEIADSLISVILFHLKKIAQNESHEIHDYASTLACVLYDQNKNKMLYFSIGDSLITATKENNCFIVAMPSDSRNGCCVTTTWNASVMAKSGIIDTENIESVMICSDGAWHLMYRRNRMQQEIRETIVDHNYDKLKEMLLGKERFDDCSFITMDLGALPRRKPA